LAGAAAAADPGTEGNAELAVCEGTGTALTVTGATALRLSGGAVDAIVIGLFAVAAGTAAGLSSIFADAVVAGRFSNNSAGIVSGIIGASGV